MKKVLLASSVSKVRRRRGQKNSYGLMPGPEGTCPGATLGKGGCLETKRDGGRPTCYVFKAFRNKRVKEILEHNTEVMKSSSYDEMVDILDREFARFEAEEDTNQQPWYHYRLHWSGDLFSADYAKAVAKAASRHPRVTFWIYTRSFDFVQHLIGVENMHTYLSIDPINMVAGMNTWRSIRKRFPKHGKRLRISYMSETDNLREQTGADTVPCPADIGRIKIEGACHKCGKCALGNSDIWFKVK